MSQIIIMSSSIPVDQIRRDRNQKSLKILVAGGSGFIGRRLIHRLSSHLIDGSDPSGANIIICMTRHPETVRGLFHDKVHVVRGDVSNYDDLRRIMTSEGPIDIAYYLVHSMEGDSKEWKKFADRDRKAASNFANAASNFGVKRIIYLSGLSSGKQEEQSEHMRSRNEVGEILKKSSARITIFRAAVILGQGGGSFQMLQYLVERLPIMVCPKWVLTRSQPISVDDVITYLVRSSELKETEGNSFDIGGPDVMTYVDMMRRYAKMIGKEVRVLVIPFLTPRLSSYWVDLVTPVKASLARPLIDSLKHEATVHDKSIVELIPLQLKSFEQSIADASTERLVSKDRPAPRERTSLSMNSKVLAISLFALIAAGTAYYVVQRWSNPYQFGDLALLFAWYFGIAFALYFIRQGARLGSLVAGIIGWVTMAFWLVQEQSPLLSLLDPSAIGDPLAVWIDAIGLVTVSFEIAASHNIFHKLRMHLK